MTDSVPLKQVKKIVDEYDAKLLATDKRFRKAVHVSHEEGTTLYFKNAFLMKMTVNKDVWIIIFTEHHGSHIYHVDDLDGYEELKPIYDPLEELK